MEKALFHGNLNLNHTSMRRHLATNSSVYLFRNRTSTVRAALRAVRIEPRPDRPRALLPRRAQGLARNALQLALLPST